MTLVRTAFVAGFLLLAGCSSQLAPTFDPSVAQRPELTSFPRPVRSANGPDPVGQQWMICGDCGREKRPYDRHRHGSYGTYVVLGTFQVACPFCQPRLFECSDCEREALYRQGIEVH